MAWEDWQDEQRAATWNEILDLLENEALRFSIDRRQEAIITVTRARWDTPSIEMRWGNSVVQRSVYVVVKGDHWPLTAEFSGAAWQDRDRPEGRERRWKSETVSSRPCADVEELRRHVRKDLEEAFQAVAALIVLDGKVAIIPSEATRLPSGKATSAD